MRKEAVEPYVHLLVERLAEEDDEIRTTGVDALGHLGDSAKPAMPELLRLALKHMDPNGDGQVEIKS